MEKSFECDDAISREELLKAIDTWDKFGYTETGCFVRITKEIDNYVPYVHLEDVITAIQNLPPVTQKSGKCKDCKWWRDSDGVYRRGVKAESKCPINTVSVANGWGYCYMFEPQESEDKE